MSKNGDKMQNTPEVNTEVQRSFDLRKSTLPHIYWADYDEPGVYKEVAVLKEDQYNNLYVLEIGVLDRIDHSRLAYIVKQRGADRFPLWELMLRKTLDNGINALEYFHALVNIVDPNGNVRKAQDNVIIAARQNASVIDTNPSEQPSSPTAEPAPAASRRGRKKTQ